MTVMRPPVAPESFTPAGLPSLDDLVSPQTAPTGGLGVSGLSATLIYTLFFFSGLASLICEVVWFKQLSLVVGSSTFAVSVVVACFFAGLALGSWLVGRASDRWKNLLRAYAILEVCLAVLSATVSYLLYQWDAWSVWVLPWMAPGAYGAKWVTVIIALALLLPATVFMGATLPVLVKYMATSRHHLARRTGSLYAINTLGAACGCFLAGFLLIGKLGVFQTALVASGVYAVVALVAFVLSAKSKFATVPNDDTPLDGLNSLSVAAPTDYPLVRHEFLIIAFALSGFASIAYEVLWFRLLIVFNITTSYAFTALLSTYLIGLVLGSWICSRFLSPHKDRLLIYFARVQLFTAVTVGISVAALGLSDRILRTLDSLIQTLGISGGYLGLISGDDLRVILFGLIILLIPTTVIGMSFPLVSELVTQRMGKVGTRVGTLYGLNTLFGVFGSLAAGFLLLPVLGSMWSFLLVMQLNLTLFALVVFSQPTLRKNFSLVREGMVVSGVVWMMTLTLGGDYLRDAQLHYAKATVIDFREDADATFTVLEYKPEGMPAYQQLVVNGISYANNHLQGRRYMAELGHLPALLHPNPKKAVVIAIGTGTTVGALSLHPSIEELWAVDISQPVFDVADHFQPANNHFKQSPKVHIVVADGRHFLLVEDRKYDVLTFEPPPPAEAGVVSLYSQEFYRIAKRRLAEGGILCQWIPFENVGREVLARGLIRTVQAEFKHVSLWMPIHSQGMVIASDKPLQIDLSELRQRMNVPEIKADMDIYGLGKPEQLLATFITAGEDLRTFVGDAPIVTDNQPYVEHFRFHPYQPYRFADLARHAQRVTDYFINPTEKKSALSKSIRAREHLWAIWKNRSLGQPLDNRDATLRHLQQAVHLDPSNRYFRFKLKEAKKTNAHG